MADKLTTEPDPIDSTTGLLTQLRRPAVIGGYIAFYTGLVLVFLALFFESLTNAWVIASLSLCAAIIAAAVVVNKKSALAALSSKRAAAGMSVALSVAAGFTILASVNWISYRHWTKWDITEDRRFTLSETTMSWLRRLDETGKELKIVTFLPFQPSNPHVGLPPDYKPRTVELLNLYRDAAETIRVVHTEPLGQFARTVEAARSIGIDEQGIPDESVVLKYGDKRRDVDVSDIYQSAPGPYGQRGPAVFLGEDAFTSAIRDLLDETPRKVYFTAGHGERGTGMRPSECGIAVEALKGMNFVVETTDLAKSGGVPDDADCVIVAGPSSPFTSGESGIDEIGHIADYLDRGGKLMVMLDTLVASEKAKASGLEKLLAQYGVVVQQDTLALGAEVDMFGGRAIVFGQPSAAHPITSPLANLRAAIFQAATLQIVQAQRSGYAPQAILNGTDGSWGERDTERSTSYDEGTDVLGPTVLAAAISPASSGDGIAPVNKAKIVIIADADLVSNRLAHDPLFKRSCNRDLFLNAVNWMVERTENIGIVPKERERRIANVTPSRRTRLFWGAFVGPTLLMIILGIAVWRARSK